MLVKYILVLAMIPTMALSTPSTIPNYNICNFTIFISQKLQNLGFHRNMSYEIIFKNPSTKGKELYFYDGCVLGVLQNLPAGVYVNPDELNDFRRAEKLTAFPNTGVNIEVPTEYAYPSNAYIFTQVSYNKVYTWLPIHARYHQAAEGGGYANNVLVGPNVFLRCPDSRLEDCDLPIKTKTYLCSKDPDRCLWKEVMPKVVNKALVWSVPVGDLDHYYVVASVTLMAVLIGSLVLIKAIHEHKVAYRQKKTINYN